jgi:hypothetical protein
MNVRPLFIVVEEQKKPPRGGAATVGYFCSYFYTFLPLEHLGNFCCLKLAHVTVDHNLSNCRMTTTIVESARSIPYEEHKFATNYVISAHYIALIRAI